MHNIDRTVGVTNYEYNNEFEGGNYEMNPEMESYTGEMEMEDEFLNELNSQGEYSGEMGYETTALSGEAMEMELATELLGVQNEAELEQFLGGLIRKAAGAVKGFANSAAGKAIGGVLKAAAKKALPIAAGALGTAIGGPAGGMLGSKLGSMASNLFELELEGLSNEDKEFELAKAYVRFANNAVRNAVRNPQFRRYPRQATRSAVVSAARRYAPGLLRPRRSGYGGYRPAHASNNYYQQQDNTGYNNASNGSGESGTWYRQGNQIILSLQEA
jgi:uncharacterized protein (DUF697 family)